MKTRNIILTVGVFLILTGTFSCRKNFLIKDNPFETQIIYNENNFVLNEKNKIEINILPDHVVITTKYKFSYKVLKGKGHFENSNNEVIKPDVKYILKGTQEKLYFVTEEVGQLSLQLDYEGTDGEKYQDIISQDAGYFSSDFTFTVVPVKNTALVDEAVAINFELDGPVSNAETNKATVKYYLSYATTASGTLTYQGNDYQAGQKFEVVPGTFSALYTGNDEAEHNITFTIENNNNNIIKKEQTVKINYAYFSSDFDFTAVTTDENLFVNDTAHIDLTLTENLKDPVTYIMIAETSETGIFLYNGTEYPAGNDIPIVPGESEILYIGTKDGTHDITFSVTNSNVHPQTHSDNVSIIFSYYVSDFNVIGIPEQTTVNVGDSVNINFTLTELLKTPNVNYTMVFNSNGAGTFTFDDSTYYATQIINIYPGQFNGKYVGTDAQTHNITFTVSNDNQYPVSKDIDISIIFEDNNFDINVTPTNGTTLPKERTQDFYLTVDGGGNNETSLIIEDVSSPYQSEPEINDVRAYFEDGNMTRPVIIDGNGGQTKINFKTYKVGEYHYKIHVTKNGIEKVQEIVLTTNMPTFTITDYHVGWVNRYWDLQQAHNATINTSYSQNIDYSFHVSDNGNTADKTVNGNTSVTSGYFYANIRDVAGEDISTITVTNEYGYSQSETVAYNVLDPRPKCTISGMHMYQPNFWHDYYILEGTITGVPKEADYCVYYAIEYWDYVQFQWRIVTNTVGHLYTNTINIEDTDYHHWNRPEVYLDKITKWRFAVTDNLGKVSEWVEYTETAPKNNKKE